MERTTDETEATEIEATIVCEDKSRRIVACTDSMGMGMRGTLNRIYFGLLLNDSPSV